MSARRLLSMMAAVLALCMYTTAFADGFAGLGSDARGFAAVVPETLLVFPEDFGAHPSFRIEWWYLTANLKDASGASYGAQWTLFRQAMEPGARAQRLDEPERLDGARCRDERERTSFLGDA